METMFSIVDGTTTTTVISTARPNSHWVCSAMPAWRAMAPSASAPRAWSSACSFCAASSNCATALVLMRLAIVAES